MGRKAVFLDRDGVLLRDVGLAVKFDPDLLLTGVADAIARLTAAGFLNVIVTNQTVIARGLATPGDIDRMHAELIAALAEGGGTIDRVYVCPHHPEATVPEFRTDCNCRKPASGMLTQAAADLDIDFSRSYLVGDRSSDIVAGDRVGARTILVRSGRHDDPPIVSRHWPEKMPDPDIVVSSFDEAVDRILSEKP